MAVPPISYRLNSARIAGVTSLVGQVRDSRALIGAASLALAMGLALTACTSAPSASKPPRLPTASPLARPLLPNVHHQTELRFVHLHSAGNPTAVLIIASTRNLQRGQRGTVLTVRKIGSLVGFCGQRHPTVRFRLTYRGAGPPTVTEVTKPLAKPAGLYLYGGLPAPQPVGGRQQFEFIQITSGGEAADFSLALWATLTPVSGGCAFSANGVLRIRCSAFTAPICTYIARRSAWAHLG